MTHPSNKHVKLNNTSQVKQSVVVYADGSCSTINRVGGWAAVMVNNNQIIARLQGSELETTSCRMEAQAVLSACAWATETQSLLIYTDSVYVASGFNKWINNWELKNWRTSSGQQVLNQEYWKRLLLVKKLDRVIIKWVAGAKAGYWHHQAHCLANYARKSLAELNKP